MFTCPVAGRGEPDWTWRASTPFENIVWTTTALINGVQIYNWASREWWENAINTSRQKPVQDGKKIIWCGTEILVLSSDYVSLNLSLFFQFLSLQVCSRRQSMLYSIHSTPELQKAKTDPWCPWNFSKLIQNVQNVRVSGCLWKTTGSRLAKMTAADI